MNIDGRKKNHGAGIRMQWTSQYNVELIRKVTEAVNQGLAKDPTNNFRNVGKLSPSEVERRKKFISK